MSIFTKNCLSCNPNPIMEAKRLILISEYCKAILRTDSQEWLGRCIITFKRHVNKMNPPTNEELLDLYKCREIIEEAYTYLFGMTYGNWCQLGNLTEDENGKPTTDQKYFHTHYHLIPRYKDPVQYLNRPFIDVEFGRALNIDPKSGHVKLVLPDADMEILQRDIVATIKNLPAIKRSGIPAYIFNRPTLRRFLYSDILISEPGILKVQEGEDTFTLKYDYVQTKDREDGCLPDREFYRFFAIDVHVETIYL